MTLPNWFAVSDVTVALVSVISLRLVQERGLDQIVVMIVERRRAGWSRGR